MFHDRDKAILMCVCTNCVIEWHKTKNYDNFSQKCSYFKFYASKNFYTIFSNTRDPVCMNLLN